MHALYVPSRDVQQTFGGDWQLGAQKVICCWQAPFTQDCPVGHACPQVPQLLASVFVFTHIVPQADWPGGH